ncbi:PTS sugar transporter subunit IIB [Gottschalkiaceae bacterium SANA]|nr:PTS sugar transporter subunit IIB [Gottschalkiaceae bacterium SANA]
MKTGLVLCRTGMGSSMMLRIKLDQVIAENNFPLELSHDVMSGANSYNVDLIITMKDLVSEFKDSGVYVIGILDIMDKQYMKAELMKFFESTT